MAQGRRIRVVHIITLLELGGAQQNTLYTVANLDRSRFDPVLIAGRGGYLDDQALSLPDTKVILLDELVRSIQPVHDLRAFLRIKAILQEFKREGGPLIVHTHSSKAGVLGRAAARMAGVKPVIYHVHGLAYPEIKGGAFAPVGRFLERWVDTWTDGFISVCQASFTHGSTQGLFRKGMKEVIRSGFDTRAYLCEEGGRDRAREELGWDLTTPRVGTIANFKPQKNPLDFIRLAARVIREEPEVRFFVAGDGVLRSEAEALAKAEGIRDRIDFLGWREDIPRLVKAMNVMAHTALWEGLPRVVVQALLARVPVVASSVDGIPEVLRDGENGYLFAPHDVDLAARRVVELLRSKGACLQPGPCPEEFTDAFDQDRMVRGQEAFYIRLLEKN